MDQADQSPVQLGNKIRQLQNIYNFIYKITGTFTKLKHKFYKTCKIKLKQ